MREQGSEQALKKKYTTARMHVIIQASIFFWLQWIVVFILACIFPIRLFSLHASTFSSIQSFNFYLQLINIVDLLRISQVLYILKIQ